MTNNSKTTPPSSDTGSQGAAATGSDPFRLDGKVVLISGAARGLGAETARTLVAAGAKVIIADLLVVEGEKTAAQLGNSAQFMRLDVTVEADWEAVVAATVRLFGSLDVLVNNAAIELAGLIADTSIENFRRQFDVNVTGVFLGVKHAIRTMRPGGVSGRGGSIINISSAAGIKAPAGLGAYSASKGAVRLLSKSAAAECGRLGYGIRVNSVHPGLIKTEMGMKTMKDLAAIGLAPDEATAEQAFLNAHLIGLGQPSDIANAVRYLASDAARWVTATETVVDGGYLAT